MTYELTYIIPLKYPEKDIPKIISKIKETLEKNSISVVAEEQPSKRKIAYPIQGNRHGYFVIAKIKTNPSNLPHITDELNNLSEILRYSITKFNPGSFEPTKETKTKEIVKKPLEIQAREKIIESSKAAASPKPNETIEPISKVLAKEAREDKSKVALEDLDKKIDEILSNDTLT